MRDAGLVGRIERVEGGQLWMGSVGVVGWWRRVERVWLRYWRRGGVEGMMVVGLGMRGGEGEGGKCRWLCEGVCVCVCVCDSKQSAEDYTTSQETK